MDKDNELLAEVEPMMANDYRIPCNSISVRNPQANAIVERLHIAIDSIICNFNIQEMVLDNENS